jgi:hypothetical protein
LPPQTAWALRCRPGAATPGISAGRLRPRFFELAPKFAVFFFAVRRVCSASRARASLSALAGEGLELVVVTV